MEFYFYPNDETEFKSNAVGNYVHTVIFNTNEHKVVNSYARKVNKHWEQTCKNNIETDHRIKELSGDHFQIYSWISKSKTDFALPFFKAMN
ncbi:hypothetical protein L2737_14620 [Shewanella electrodiphila]|jgi:hypothetical protein|uniref:Uncharacterized protein n=1 Tax=Shewanella electrodiphila TaxID=934143 RepID=A0ABT0KRR3_9GAMM|nr:hypothetical protein [Shewanella electrodiphila]MCL1046545.1 hypothetical protein [Shewanella electrodiphila]